MRKVILVLMNFFNIFFSYLYPENHKNYQYDLSIGAIFQNEAPYLKEWIDYHHLIGVEHFILYNHYSTDNYLEILEPYISIGLVELINCEMKEYPKVLLDIYRKCIKYQKNTSKWLAMIDIDEFILTKNDIPIKEFLKEFEHTAGLAINWQIFGTSNIKNLEGKSVLKNLTKKFPEHFHSRWNSNRYIKSIIRPDRINEDTKNINCGNHIFMPNWGYSIVTSSHEIQPPSCVTQAVNVDRIQINHYWFRDEDWFYKTKVHRRNGVGEDYPPEKIKYLFQVGNLEEDLLIKKFIEKNENPS